MTQIGTSSEAVAKIVERLQAPGPDPYNERDWECREAADLIESLVAEHDRLAAKLAEKESERWEASHRAAIAELNEKACLGEIKRLEDELASSRAKFADVTGQRKAYGDLTP